MKNLWTRLLNWAKAFIAEGEAVPRYPYPIADEEEMRQAEEEV
jgi:hypothetical protein